MDYDYRRAAGKSNNMPMILAIGGAATAVIVGLLAVIAFLLMRDDHKPSSAVVINESPRQPVLPPPPGGFAPQGNQPQGIQPSNNQPPANYQSPQNRAPARPSVPNQPKEEETPRRPANDRRSNDKPLDVASPPRDSAPSDVLPDLSSLTSSGGGASGQEVYQYALKSVVWIINVIDESTGMAAMGSGSLVDKKNRIVLTNHHVVDANKELFVFFPNYKNGKLVTEAITYLNAAKSRSGDLIRAKVLTSTRTKDLALIELDRLPDGVEAIPLAEGLVAPGQTVHSVGNPGGTQALWIYTSGTVRQTSHKTWRSGAAGGPIYENEADVIETQSPTNPGDSGGPLLNDHGELIGVTQGGSRAANLLSIFVNVTEVRTVLDDYLRQKGGRWVGDARPPLRTGKTGPSMGDLASVIKSLEHKDAKIRSKAAGLLGDVGPAARLGVPGLLKLLSDHDPLVRRVAGEALNKIGPPEAADVQLLVTTLEQGDPVGKLYAADSFGKMGPEARIAVPTLLPLLKSDDASLRSAAARSLGRMGTEVKDQVVPALTQALNDSQPSVRGAAAEGLALLAARDAIVLTNLLKQKDVEVRVQGALGLALLGKDAKGAVPDLIEAAKSSDGALRKAAFEALGGIGPDAKGAANVFIDGLKDGDKDIRLTAIRCVALLGPEARNAVPALVDCMRDPTYQKDALAAIGRIGPNAKAAAQPLADLLKDSDKNLQELAMIAIAGLGPEGKPAVANLINLFDNKDRDLHSPYRKRIAQTLAKIGKPAVPLLIGALNDNNGHIVHGAIMALGEMGSIARDCLPTLRKVPMSWLDDDIRDEVDKAMRKIR